MNIFKEIKTLKEIVNRLIQAQSQRHLQILELSFMLKNPPKYKIGQRMIIFGKEHIIIKSYPGLNKQAPKIEYSIENHQFNAEVFTHWTYELFSEDLKINTIKTEQEITDILIQKKS